MEARQTISEPGKKGFMDRTIAACKGPNALRAWGGATVLESTLVPFPIELAMLPVLLGQKGRFWLIALIGAIGSTIGAVICYLIGALFMATAGQPLIDFFGWNGAISQVEALFAEHGPLAVAIAGLSPIPFQAGTLVAGATGMNFLLFVGVAFAVRLVRFIILGAILLVIGESVVRSLKWNPYVSIAIMIAIIALGAYAMANWVELP